VSDTVPHGKEEAQLPRRPVLVRVNSIFVISTCVHLGNCTMDVSTRLSSLVLCGGRKREFGRERQSGGG
jgi:hypothetical protein